MGRTIYLSAHEQELLVEALNMLSTDYMEDHPEEGAIVALMRKLGVEP